jgi:RHS repeat-associated protein
LGPQSRWAYDAEGRPVSVETAGRTVNFGYDIAGRETERLLDTGPILAQAWDVNHRLTEQTVSTVAGGGQPASGAHRARLIQRRGCHYRADGYIDAIEDRIHGTRRFELDDAGRITSVQGTGWSEMYAYDSAGQLIDSRSPGDPGEQGPRTYAGSLVQRAGDLNYRHDAQGRVVLRQKKRLSAKPDTWRLGCRGPARRCGDARRFAVALPLRPARPPDRQAAFYPGREGRRRAGGFPLGRRGHRGRVTNGVRATTWNWEPGSFRVISQTERQSLRDAPQQGIDQRFFSIVTDVIGTPTELVDTTGNLAWRSETTLWGRALSSLTATASTPLRFAGQYFDAESQLHYNYARYYDPASGGYHSADPLGLGGGTNPHGYVPNPMFWIDPFGLAKRKKCDGDTGNVQTLSGWTGKEPDPPHITRAGPQDVLALQQQIGHPVKRAGARDQGVPGKYFASHAERQRGAGPQCSC